MKTIVFLSIAAATIAGCASSPSSTSSSSSLGQFVMSGPTSAVAPQLSIRWQYGLMINADQKTITEVRFSCAPIPGTTFSVKGEEFKRLNNGALFVEGPVIPVSQESTPWLFESSNTSALCKASVARLGQPEALITAPVNFAPSVKSATLMQLKVAHEFNAPAKK